MAFVGLSKPYVAQLINEASKQYSNGFKCGKAISLNVTPNYNEAKLNADNQLAEYVKEFKDGNITFGTSTLPKEAATVMFGHTVSEDGKTVTYKADDTANNVGVGFVVDQMVDGKKTFVATIIFKAKFTEAAADFTTKGDNIEFKTPSIEGTISPLETKEWKETKEFTTEAEAIEFVKTTLNITDAEPSA